jgi:hypothetical protein
MMDKINPIIEKITGIGNGVNRTLDRFEKGDINKSDIRKLMFAVAALTAVILMITTANVWFPYVLMVVAAIALLKPSKPIIPPMPLWYQVLTYAVASVINDNHKRIGARTVDMEHIGELLNTWHVTPDGVKMAEIQVEKDEPTVKIGSDEELNEKVKIILDYGIRKRLKRNTIVGVPFDYFDGVNPVIFVAKVQDVGSCFIINVIFADNQKAIDYIKQLKSPENAVCAVIDTDF